jgi:hypothetical protein
MKAKILLLMLLGSQMVSAQLTITPGAQLTVSGNAQLTLQNTDLVNNGNFTPGNGITRFTGNTSSSVSGSQAMQFFELDLNKTNNASVVLQRAIGVTQRIFFSSGFLNLNGFDADLGNTGRLDNEQENSRVTGANGGQVLFNTILNAPSAANPANLGAIISSSQNLGNVVIKRGHQSQQGAGLNNSILRYYDIIPANNTSLDATLRFTYFNGELNDLNERVLAFFSSTDDINWAETVFASSDTLANFAEITGIASFSRWTISKDAIILPVRFLSFHAGCEGNRVQINWTTAEEQNSSHYNIERSQDGVTWTVIGNLPAAGSSSIESSYSLADDNPLQNGYYRIAQYDLDGGVSYTRVIGTSCNVSDVFSISPNPTRNIVLIHLTGTDESQAIISVFDIGGALVMTQKEQVTRGSNQYRLDLGTLANGVYAVSVEWENGQKKKSAEIIRQ